MQTGVPGLAPKIGEGPRPDTYKKPVWVPTPTNHEEAWLDKAKIPDGGFQHLAWVTNDTINDDATSVAQAWMKRPENKMQLPSMQRVHDADGDGVIDQSEFKELLKAAGSGTDASILFNAMDADGDGVLTEAEIKALGQDRDNRSRIRTM